MQNVSQEPGYCNQGSEQFEIIPVMNLEHFYTDESKLPRQTFELTESQQADINKISVDPLVPKVIRERLWDIHKRHAKVFDNDLSIGYNGYAGDFTVDFNFLNNIPPPINYGCVPTYTKPADQILLQAMIDKLEANKIVTKANDLKNKKMTTRWL